MCGIAGILSQTAENINSKRLEAMANAMHHRGPDGQQIYINEEKMVGLAHRRLSIIDLSEKGNQPMHYLHYTIVHNGEVYNYIELKKTLEQKGYSFASNSDTEVIIAAYDCYKEKCLDYFDGMFAFVIWDEKEKKLFAARDRFGEKPFYYFYNGKEFCFASELKGLWAAGIPKEPNLTLFCLFLGLGYTSIPIEPQISFYKNIFVLPAATYITIHCSNNKFDLKEVQYWDIDKQTTSTLSEQDAIDHFTELFNTSIKRRLRSDVAIGTSLSGGLDSSSIAGFLKSISVGTYKSFSSVFPGYEKDESKYIDLIKQKLSIENYSVQPNANDFEENFQQLISIQEQPFASSSAYAQYKVFELAKQNNTTVLLDGQGADETLAGYTKYLHWYLQELYMTDKQRYRSELDLIKKNHPHLQWGLSNKLAALLPIAATNRLEKRAANQLIWKSHLEQSFVTANFSKLLIQKPLVKKLNDVLYYNSMQFGLQELLTYADKNAMANSVEVRLPFLQHELVQFIFSLPSHYKIQQGFTKYILRKSIDKMLPDEIVWRKEKVGYETPQQDWLQSAFFKNKIETAKKKLIDMGILQKNILSKNTENDWRIMIAAEYL